MDVFDYFQPFIDKIQQKLQETVQDNFPRTLKEPIRYFLESTGKKVRPLLALFSCRFLNGETDCALPAAVGIELFHDFTLIHDDIMDRDDFRRGRPTIHKLWDEGAAILVGDALIGMAYTSLLKSRSTRLPEVVNHFSEALIKVCEGQALDKEFEERPRVSLDEYLDMIAKKTAWLFQLSCQIGGILGNGDDHQVNRLMDFGFNVGMAFQIQDDLLDFVADESKLGKAVGSDWKMDKKTFITLKFQEKMAREPDLARRYPPNIWEFKSLSHLQKALYALNIVDETQQTVDDYLQRAVQALQQIKPLPQDEPLMRIVKFLEHRQY